MYHMPKRAAVAHSDHRLLVVEVGKRQVGVVVEEVAAVTLARVERLAPHYVLELRREGALDTLDVLVETRIGGDGDAAELAGRAEHLIKAYVGVTTTVRVVAPGTIERSQGKAKRVIDLRPKP